MDILNVHCKSVVSNPFFFIWLLFISNLSWGGFPNSEEFKEMCHLEIGPDYMCNLMLKGDLSDFKQWVNTPLRGNDPLSLPLYDAMEYFVEEEMEYQYRMVSFLLLYTGTPEMVGTKIIHDIDESEFKEALDIAIVRNNKKMVLLLRDHSNNPGKVNEIALENGFNLCNQTHALFEESLGLGSLPALLQASFGNRASGSNFR